MNLLLIWPHNQHFNKIQESFPLGMGYLLSSLGSKSYNVTFLDCVLEKIKPGSSKFSKIIKSAKPDIIGISWWSQNSDTVEETLHVVKSILPSVITVVGGPHPTVRAGELMRNSNCDFIFRGEAEIGFSMLLDSVRKQDFSQIKEIPGLVFRDKTGKVVMNKQQFIDNLDTLGSIDYNTLNLNKYNDHGYTYGRKAIFSEGARVGPIMATRGCPYLCQFCSARDINGSKIRTHSPVYIVETIEKLYHHHKVRLISLLDDNFTFNLDFAAKVCDGIISLGYSDLRMATPNGIHFEKITKEIAEKMYAAG